MEILYQYAGYDMVHKISNLKNHYIDTKENIIKYLHSQLEFIEGTTEEEKEKYFEEWFQCYTKPLMTESTL